MRITDLNCALLGNAPLVRITTNLGIDRCLGATRVGDYPQHQHGPTLPANG